MTNSTPLKEGRRHGRLIVLVLLVAIFVAIPGILSFFGDVRSLFRTITIRSVSGPVEWVPAHRGAPRLPAAGETLEIGDAIRTGEDGQVVLELDDGTLLLIGSDSDFVLMKLEGIPVRPLTEFFGERGQIFAFRLQGTSLPYGFGFEVQAPNGRVSIRGSAVGIEIVPDSAGSTTTVICITGTCIIENGQGQVSSMAGGLRAEVAPAGTIGGAVSLSQEDTQLTMDALQTIQASTDETLSIDISYCNNEIGGETEIEAGREYIAITRPGCWPTPEEAAQFQSAVGVAMRVDGDPAGFVGYGPTAECLPGGLSTGTYNFGAYYQIGPFTAGEHTVETVHSHETEGFTFTEECILRVP